MEDQSRLSHRIARLARWSTQPEIGCVLAAIVVVSMCLMPIFFVRLMHTALGKLHLAGPICLLVVLGVVIGGFFNLPLKRLERHTVQETRDGLLGRVMSLMPLWRPKPTQTIIAVNVGGCLIPVAVALYQCSFIFGEPTAVRALAIVSLINVVLCYFAAQPVAGVGIVMPAYLSPLVAVVGAWILLSHESYDGVRASVAFSAGVIGPLVGADLLHLRHIARVSAGMLSIGGAGKYDGIVLSGFLAALLA